MLIDEDLPFEVPAFPSSRSRIFAAVWSQPWELNHILKPLPRPVRAPCSAQRERGHGRDVLPSNRHSPARGLLPLPPDRDSAYLFGIKGCVRAALSSRIFQLQLLKKFVYHFRLLLLLHLRLGGVLMRDQFLTQKPFFLLEGLDGAFRHLYTTNQVCLNSRLGPIYFFLELRDSHARFFEGIGKC
ncbi:hypothetical protein C8J57DRAFT_1330451, partial [Mycena rebaudengoi]